MAMPDTYMTRVERIHLRMKKYAVRQAAPAHVVVGVNADVDMFADHMMDAMVYTLEALFPAEDAGPPAMTRQRVLLPLRPWWIPKWAWQRVPCKDAAIEIRVQPEWVYPQAPPELVGRARKTTGGIEVFKTTFDWKNERPGQ